MGLAFTVVYHESVVKEDIAKLSTTDKIRIKQSIEEKLINELEVFGKPLRRSLKGYRKLRVGDYRVIFRIEQQIIKVFCIGHRSTVYNIVEKRVV